MDYRDLVSDHDRIDALADELEGAVRSCATPAPQVDALLDRLADVVKEHLQKEDSFIYPDLLQSSDPVGATGLAVEFETLKRDWETYLATWRHGLAQQDWPAFREQTFGMLKRLRERVMKETGLLYSMALSEGLITMRPASRSG